ncbi:hypothetical protein ACIQBJ_32100 [Kitasatospora sp. NPDC088391]|uniref:hypothetical protein n=1 Tax=Kitasatospora sp. NPDC088391 TaxID=3364074 RepID=UPI0037F9D28F
MNDEILKAIAELTTRIDNGFKQVDKRFDAQSSEFDSQFTSFYQHVENEFDKVHTEIALTQNELKREIARVYTLLDGDTKQREIDDHERAALGLQLDRLDEEVKALKIKLA